MNTPWFRDRSWPSDLGSALTQCPKSLALIYVPTLFVCVIGCSGSNRKGADPTVGIDQHLTAAIADLKKACEKQSALLDRALGDHDACDAELVKFQAILNDQISWPKTSEEANKLRERLVVFVKQMPPLAQEHFLPMLIPIRWSVEALGVANQNGGEEMGDRLIACEALLENAPDDAPEAIVHLLQELHNTAAAATQVEAVEMAEKSLETGNGVEEAWSALETYTDDEIKSLRERLRAKLVDVQVKDRASGLRAQLDLALRSSDSTLRRVGVTRVYEAVVSMKLDSLAQPTSADAVSKYLDPVIHDAEAALTKLANVQQKADAKRLREYQRWALSQIQQCERWFYDLAIAEIKEKFSSFEEPEESVTWELLRVLPDVRSLMAEKTNVEISGPVLSPEQQAAIYKAAYGKVSWHHAEELAYRATRDATVKFLGPIDERYLDPPVLRLYNKAFERAWSKLEGRDEQMYIAEQAAQIVKRTPNDPAESR